MSPMSNIAADMHGPSSDRCSSSPDPVLHLSQPTSSTSADCHRCVRLHRRTRPYRIWSFPVTRTTEAPIIPTDEVITIPVMENTTSVSPTNTTTITTSSAPNSEFRDEERCSIQCTSFSNLGTITTPFYCGASCLNQSWFDPSGLIALWRFDGSLADINNIYNGSSPKSSPTFKTGYFGQAAFFNASLKQAIFTPFIQLHEVSFTIEAWINPTAFPNPSDESIVGLCPSQIADYCLHINIRRKKLYFGFYYNDVQGISTIQTNQWIHTAFVFDIALKQLTIYLNGAVDGQAYVTSPLLLSSGNVTIGTNEGVALPNNYFQVRDNASVLFLPIMIIFRVTWIKSLSIDDRNLHVKFWKSLPWLLISSLIHRCLWLILVRMQSLQLRHPLR